MSPDRERTIADHLRRMARRWSEPADQWCAKVQRWVDAGIVTSVQGVEIVATESNESDATTGSVSDEDRSTISPIIELLSYFGIVVACLSSALFLSHYWGEIGTAGHLSVALTITGAGLSGGSLVAQFGDAGARRLSGFLQLLGTGGAAMTTAVIIGPTGKSHHGLAMLCVGVVVLGLSASLWRNRDRPLQFLTTLLGVVLTISALGSVAHLHATSTEISLLVWLFASAVGIMSLQMLRPAPTALVVAELGGFVGAIALSFPNHLGGVLLGVLSTACAVGIGFALERPLIIVTGAVGFFMFDFRIFTIYLRSSSAAVGALVLGLVLVLVALVLTWRATLAERSAADIQKAMRTDVESYEPW